MHEVHWLPRVVTQLVRRVQTRQRVERDAQRDADRQAPTARRRAREQTGQRIALDVLHHQEVAGLAGTDLEDGHDVRMMNARRDARFVEEHLDELFLTGKVRVEPLHRHEALEAADAREAREIHRRHAAGRNFADEFIAIDALSPRAGSKSFATR